MLSRRRVLICWLFWKPNQWLTGSETPSYLLTYLLMWIKFDKHAFVKKGNDLLIIFKTEPAAPLDWKRNDMLWKLISGISQAADPGNNPRNRLWNDPVGLVKLSVCNGTSSLENDATYTILIASNFLWLTNSWNVSAFLKYFIILCVWHVCPSYFPRQLWHCQSCAF